MSYLLFRLQLYVHILSVLFFLFVVTNFPLRNWIADAWRAHQLNTSKIWMKEQISPTRERQGNFSTFESSQLVNVEHKYISSKKKIHASNSLNWYQSAVEYDVWWRNWFQYSPHILHCHQKKRRHFTSIFHTNKRSFYSNDQIYIAPLSLWMDRGHTLGKFFWAFISATKMNQVNKKRAHRAITKKEINRILCSRNIRGWNSIFCRAQRWPKFVCGDIRSL